MYCGAIMPSINQTFLPYWLNMTKLMFVGNSFVYTTFLDMSISEKYKMEIPKLVSSVDGAGDLERTCVACICFAICVFMAVFMFVT